MPSDPVLIAIDGPSGVGKSTIAARVARELDLPYLETGAMYRALGWQLMKAGIDPTDREAVERMATEIDLELAEGEGNRAIVLLDGQPLDSNIRSPAVSEATSHASSHPGVRREMVERQRLFAYGRGAVLEGRDIGTRVFPDTPFKFFLTAPQDIRIERRIKQLAGIAADSLDREKIKVEVEARDERDRRREESPLTMNDSYTILDTGDLAIDEVVERIVGAVR
jgi:cytidylate kinase